ncbi:MAG TPA: NFACT RNA binding domain-containing protein [Haliangiales bacterium]|nr:NFACT RNA binding domain-containing protein [Haliangiales bacterium]
MSLSDAEVALVAAELAPRLHGHVGKIFADPHDPFAIVVEIGRDRLVLSAHPRASRIHLQAERAPAAGPPPAFAMLLRKRLSGLRPLLSVLPGERVVTLDFGPGHDRLVAELTGPHANVFLVAPDGTIAGALRPSRSATRPLAPGSAWTPPPTAPPDARWRGRNRFGAGPGAAERMAAHYAAFLAEEETRALRERLGGALRRDFHRLTRREAALEGDMARIAEAARYRKLGDLLLAHAHALPGRGAASAVVPDDFEDGAPLTIPLDPALDARENAARYYRQHKRLTAGRRHAEGRLAATRAEMARLRARLDAVPSLSLEELRARAPAVPARARRRSDAEADAERLPFREFRSVAGEVIWVGRSAADNDALTFRHARGGDTWLHARDAPGAHVVVPARGGRPPAAETLLDAATLAAHYSPLAKEAQVDVHVAQVKNLRKPRSAPPGMVYASETKTIRVRMEAERVRRLLES